MPDFLDTPRTVKASSSLWRVSVLSITLATLVFFLSDALAATCSGEASSGSCPVPSGEYFIALPEIAPGALRTPAVIILHDAGRGGLDVIRDQELVGKFLERGYAVIAPNASKRKYNRSTLTSSGQGSGAAGARKSRLRYVLENPDGSLRTLKQGQDRGWYFYSSDVAVQPSIRVELGNPKASPRGRDENAFVKQVLNNASQRFWIDQTNSVIVGIGHGGALAWQMACRSPETAALFLPVNGAFWGGAPKICRGGGKLIHTHERRSDFWPINGAKTKKKRFGQSSIFNTLEMYARSNGCQSGAKEHREDWNSHLVRSWSACGFNSSVDLLILEKPFDFPEWWLDLVLKARSVAGDNGSGGAPQSETLAKPRFLKPRFTSEP